MKFTYYTIIGKDENLLKGHIDNVKKYAGFDSLDCDKEFFIVVYRNKKIPTKKTDLLMSICEENNIRYHLYDEPGENFLDNLYACWNLGYELAEDGPVFRGGSDQVFSKSSFPALLSAYNKTKEEKVILQANTIENPHRAIGTRHMTADLGDTFETFDLKSFEEIIFAINAGVVEEVIDIIKALDLWKHPTKLRTSLGVIDRVDGCSWLMTKSDWKKYGPLPTIENGITGDVIIHDRLQLAGYKEYIVKDCVTYHFVKGESYAQNY